MNILFIKHFLYDLWFLRYRECPYSGTFRISLLSLIQFLNNNYLNNKLYYQSLS